MAKKRAAGRGRNDISSGSMNSVELGRNGEYRPAKKPSPEGVEGSQSDHVRTGSEPTDEEAAATRALVEMAAGGDGAAEPSAQLKPTTAEPTSSREDDGGQMSSRYSTSRRQEERAKKLHPLDEDEDEKESEEESTEAPDPNPQPKRKRDSGRVTRSQQPKVPAPTEQRGKEGAQPSESKKRKSKKITPAPLQQQASKSKKPKANKITPPPLQHQDEEIAQPCESEMPKSKKITPAPLQQQPNESKKPKTTRITPAPLHQQDEQIAQPCEPKSNRITPAPLQQQPSEKKPKSKKITPAPLQQQPSKSKKPKSKKITPPPSQHQDGEIAQPCETEMPKSKKITPPPSQYQDEEIAQPCETEMPKSKRIRFTRSEQPKVPAPTEQRKEVAQRSESKKPKSKQITPAPLQQQPSESKKKPKTKKITPAPLQQQDEETAQPCESEKSNRIRRLWTPSDEVQILKALLKHRRKQGKLPAPDNNDFFDSILKRLEDKSFNRKDIKDKVRSLMRRYISYVAPTTDHEKRLHHLSNRVWGDLPATHAANGNNVDGEQDEGEHAMAMAGDGGGQSVDKSFQEKCEMYPLLGQEATRLAEVQPALRSSFTVLDGKKAILMEKKLDQLKWKELRIQAELEAKVEAPKARIRVELINVLSEVSKKL